MDRDPAAFRAAASAGAHVTQMAFLVIGGTWAGSWLDGRFGTQPGFLLLGAGVGMSSGIFLLVRSFQEHPPPDEPDDPADSP